MTDILGVKDSPSLSVIHLLPCSIDYDGSAPVNSFFHVAQEADGTLTSHLRGRELKGKVYTLEKSTATDPLTAKNGTEVDVPHRESVVGLCIGQSADSKWTVEGHFAAIRVWEHDTLPDLSLIDNCVSWFATADCVSKFLHLEGAFLFFSSFP